MHDRSHLILSSINKGFTLPCMASTFQASQMPLGPWDTLKLMKHIKSRIAGVKTVAIKHLTLSMCEKFVPWYLALYIHCKCQYCIVGEHDTPHPHPPCVHTAQQFSPWNNHTLQVLTHHQYTCTYDIIVNTTTKDGDTKLCGKLSLYRSESPPVVESIVCVNFWSWLYI